MGSRKKKPGIGIVLLISFVLALSVLAARLPTNGQDSGSWGTLLNDFLDVAHDTGGSIKGGAVGSGALSDAGIQAIDINQSVVNGTHILAQTIEAIDIGIEQVNTSRIANLTITAIKVAASAVNTSHILDLTITNADIAFAAVNQSLIAPNAINSSQIVDLTITNADIAFAAVNQSLIAPNAINSSQIVDLTITNADIAFAAVNQSLIAPNAINSSQIVDNTIGGIDLANDSVNATVLLGVNRLIFGICNVAVPSLQAGNTNNTATGAFPAGNCTIPGALVGDAVIVMPTSGMLHNATLINANISTGGNLTLEFRYDSAVPVTTAGNFGNNATFNFIVYANATN